MTRIQQFLTAFALLFAGHAAAQTQPSVVYVSCVVPGSVCTSSPNAAIEGNPFGSSPPQVISAAGYAAPGDAGGGIFALQPNGCSITGRTGNTTSGSPTITEVSSLAGITTGMVISGAGIPGTPPTTVKAFGNDITSGNGNTITLSQNATAPGTTVSLTLDGNNEGTVVLDGSSPPNCFRRIGGDTSILNFGARCDAAIQVNYPITFSTTMGVTSFTSTDTTFLNWAYTEKYTLGLTPYLAIAGASATGGTLPVVITSVSGTASGSTVDISLPAGAPSNFSPLYYASGFANVYTAGGGYSVGSTFTAYTSMTMGTAVATITVLGVSAGGITNAVVTGQIAGISALPAGDLVYDQGSGGAVLKLNFLSTGSYAYGSDNSQAVNNALNAVPQNTDVYVPANLSFGIANTLILPTGNNSLRGANQDSSELVALAAMPPNPSNSTGDNTCPHSSGGQCTYAIIYPNTSGGGGGSGGGMRDLHVDAFGLADYAVGDLAGQDQAWLGVTATDGTISDFLYGNAYAGATFGTQITNILFDHLHGKTETTEFPIAAQIPQYAFTTKTNGTGAVIANSHFENALEPIGDEQTDHNLYIGDRVTANPPHNANYCVDAAAAA